VPSGHSEITAYINDGDVRRVADALTALCAREGMQLLPAPRCQSVRYVLQPSDRWNFALLPGAPRWTVVHGQPWNTLCRPSATGPSRFVDLCSALGVRGFMVDVIDIVPHGRMLVETDGCGLRRLSGFYFSDDEREEAYHGTPLSLDGFEASTFEICADLAGARLLDGSRGLDFDTCRAIAHEVGGSNGELLWTSGEDFSGAWSDIQEAMSDGGPVPGEGGLLLQFESAKPGVKA